MCVSILYLCFSFWLTSLCIIGSSFIHLIRTDSNVFKLKKDENCWCSLPVENWLIYAAFLLLGNQIFYHDFTHRWNGLSAFVSIHKRDRQWKDTYHNPSEQTDSLPTICVRHHVTITDGEKSYWYQPHCSKEVASHILLIMVPEK